MARHRRDYDGEKFTARLRLQLTPSQRETLEKAAARAGTTLNQYTRELCLRRSGAAETVAGTRRNPDTEQIVAQLIAIGTNLNQLTKVANTTRAAPQFHELKMTTDFLRVVFTRVLAL